MIAALCLAILGQSEIEIARLPGYAGGVCWSKDSRQLYYTHHGKLHEWPDTRHIDRAARPEYRFLVGLSDFWCRLWAVRSPNAECPLCGVGVVVAPNRMPGVGYGDSSRIPRPRKELIAACAEHGHPPFNDQTVKYYARSDPGKQ